MDTRLQEAGIHLDEIESRLDGQGKVLVITSNELIFADESGLQRAPLRQVTKVAIDKTGSLSIRSTSSDLITGNIRGFDLTALKFFLEGAKSSIAKAKSAARAPTITQAAPVAAIPEPVIPKPIPEPVITPEPVVEPQHAITQPTVRPDTGTLEEAAWGHDPAHRQPTFDTWSTTRDSDMNSKSSSDMHKSFEIAPDDDAPTEPHADQKGKTAGLEWAEDAITVPENSSPKPEATQIHVFREPDLGATDVHSEVHEWKENFNLPTPQTAQTDTEILPSNAVDSAGKSDWSGEILEASTSLETNPQIQPTIAPSNAISVSKDPTPTIDRPISIANLPNLAPFARWLRILSVFIVLLGVSGLALQLPATFDTNIENLKQLVIAFSYFFVGLILGLIAYGLAELFSAWSSLAADVRSLKRNSMGN